MIELTIKTLDSHNHQFSVHPDTTVAQLKDIITEHLHIEPADQRLIFCGRVLQNENKLSTYNVDHKVIHLVQRPPPSQLRPPPSSANARTNRTRNLPLGHEGRAGAGLVFETYNISTDMENQELSRGTVLWITIERLEHVRRLLQDIRDILDNLESTARLFATDNQSSLHNPSGKESNGQERAEGEAAAGPSSSYSGAEYFTTTNTNTEGNDSNLVTDGLPRAALLADILEEVHGLQGRLLPFYRQYIAHLRDHNTRAEAERADERLFYNNQAVSQKIRILMHSFSHAYHAISEIQYEFDENRLTSGPPPPHPGIPIQAQINVLTSRRPPGAQPDGAAAQPDGAATQPDGAVPQPDSADPQPDRPIPQREGAALPPAAVEVTIDEFMGHFQTGGGGPRPTAAGMPYHVQIETHMPIAIAVAERLPMPTQNQTQTQTQQPARQAESQRSAPSVGTGPVGGSAPLGTAPSAPLAGAETTTGRPANAGAVPRPRVTVMPLNFSDMRGEPMEMLMPEFAGMRTMTGGAELPGGVTHEFIHNIIQTVLNRTPGAMRHDAHLHTHTHQHPGGGGVGQGGVGPFRVSRRPRDTSRAQPTPGTVPPTDVQPGNTERPSRGPRFPQNLVQDLISANRSVRGEGRRRRAHFHQHRSYDRFLACASPFRDRNLTGRYPVVGQRRSDGERLDMLNSLVTALDQYSIINYFDPMGSTRSDFTNELLSFLAKELTLGDIIRLFLGNWRPLVRLHSSLNEMMRRQIDVNMDGDEQTERFRETADHIINLQNDFWTQLASYIIPNQSDEPSNANIVSSVRSLLSHSITSMMDLIVNTTQAEVFGSSLYQLVVRSIEETCTLLYMSCTDSHSGAENAIRDYMRRILGDFDPHYQILLFTLMQSALAALRIRIIGRQPFGEGPTSNNQQGGQDEPAVGPSPMEQQNEAEFEELLSHIMSNEDLVLNFDSERPIPSDAGSRDSSSSDNPPCPDTPESPDEEDRVPNPRAAPFNHCYTANYNPRGSYGREIDASLYSRFAATDNQNEGSQDSVKTDDLVDVDQCSVNVPNDDAVPSSSGNTSDNIIPSTDSTLAAANSSTTDAAEGITVSAQPEPSQGSITPELLFEAPDSDGEAAGGLPANAVDEVAIGTDITADWSKTVPVEWIPVLTEDTRQQWRQVVQPPFSDAYLSGMPARKRKIIQQRKPQSFQQLFQDNLREANAQQQQASGTSSGRPAPVSVSDGDEQLLQAYCEAARREARARITTDPDFTPQRYPASQLYYNTPEPPQSGQKKGVKKS